MRKISNTFTLSKKCDYCRKRRKVNPETEFYRECTEQFQIVTDKYLNGNPFLPLEVARELSKT